MNLQGFAAGASVAESRIGATMQGETFGVQDPGPPTKPPDPPPKPDGRPIG